MRATPSDHINQLASLFARVASAIDSGIPDEQVRSLLRQTHACCLKAQADGAGARGTLLSNLHVALTTWEQVWPRLGPELAFRQAVSREANLWARRLHACAPTGSVASPGSS